ncbi:UNVERIFIED_CONTAM: hypothetical protein FKN15_002272 [Acipenser sinensis]
MAAGMSLHFHRNNLFLTGLKATILIFMCNLSGARTRVSANLLHMVAESVGAPTTLEMESIEELIERINRNTAAQIEQTAKFERWAIDMGLAPPKSQEREPTELERLILAWELPLPEPREEELPLPE